MTATIPLTLTFTPALAVAALAAVVAAIAVFVRRTTLPFCSLWLGGLGIVVLCLATANPHWRKSSPQSVAVMVDLSPSTRGADFRTRRQLETRVRALLGRTPYHIYYFASDISRDEPIGETLPDIPADHTAYTPLPGATAVVLFSDGRFDAPPIAPPTYVVIDPLLESPIDGAISSLELHGGEVSVTTSNSGPPRQLTLDGTNDVVPATAPPGPSTLARPIDVKASHIVARLSPGDAWPENDQLLARPPPPEHREHWWVGTSPPDASWRTFSPEQVPTDAGVYLSASVIVLNNVPATALTTLQQQRLGQYVRDLGGGLVIFGGDHAFAARTYPGSELESLSPLASTPPRPTTHWIILTDSSGSMAEMVDGISLWHRATDSIVKLLPHLPPEDVLSLGSFAEQVTWWQTAKTVKQTSGMTLPPPNIAPHGPTNLEHALFDEIAGGVQSELPRQLILLTDAEAEIKDPVALELALRQKKIRLHLLAIGEGSALPILRRIVRSTGGTLVKQLDPRKWTEAIEAIEQAGAPTLLGVDPLPVQFIGELSSLGKVEAMPWNRAWLKESATLLAEGTDAGKPTAAAARWNLGEGRVLAAAFNSADAAQAMAQAVGQPPRDPRYRVTWSAAAQFRVSVDAIEGNAYLNGKRVTLELAAESETHGAGHELELPQAAPGRYEIALPAPRMPSFATVRVDGRVVDRIAVAGRYAPEFDHIGNDHEAMENLARRTGGQIIAPRQTWPIDFRWPVKTINVTSIFAMVGAAIILLALTWWKLAG